MSPAGVLRVVHVDEAIVVVSKPAGMPSVPARSPLDPPAVARVLAAEFGPLEAAHRLDRDTSGLLVLARTRQARVALGGAFERGDVRKRYLAVVEGRPTTDGGEIRLPLAADRDRPPRQRIDVVLGRRAATRWRLVAVGAAAAAGTSLLEVEPLTGRSHQIRVHLAWLGCAVVGDRLYGPAADAAGSADLALHASALDLPHPMTGQRLALLAEPPLAMPWAGYSATVTRPSASWPSLEPSPRTARSVPDR